jgi:hypothetical protein
MVLLRRRGSGDETLKPVSERFAGSTARFAFDRRAFRSIVYAVRRPASTLL